MTYVKGKTPKRHGKKTQLNFNHVNLPNLSTSIICLYRSVVSKSKYDLQSSFIKIVTYNTQ